MNLSAFGSNFDLPVEWLWGLRFGVQAGPVEEEPYRWTTPPPPGRYEVVQLLLRDDDRLRAPMVAERPFCTWLAARLKARPEALHGKHCWRGALEAARDETLRGGSARGVSARKIGAAAPGRRGPRGTQRAPLRAPRRGLGQP